MPSDNVPANMRVLTPLAGSHAAFDVTDDRAMKALLKAEDEHFWHRARNRFIADRLFAMGVPAKTTLLELGCGGGCVSAYLTSRGYVVTGVDGHVDLVARAATRAPGAKFYVHDLSRGLDALPPAHYDVVALFDVIEHLDDPRAALTAALDRLKKGGRLVGTVPALMSLWSQVDVQAGHRLRYDEHKLMSLLESIPGSAKPKVIPFYRSLVPLLWMQRKMVVKGGDVGKTSEANFAVPPRPINQALYALVRAESKLSSWLEDKAIPGSCLWFELSVR